MDRLELYGPVRGEVTVVAPVEILDLSVSGMQVETVVPLHVEAAHEFRLILGNDVLVVRGRVAYARITDVERDGVRYRSGIDFVDTPERVITAIQEFLVATRRARERADR